MPIASRLTHALQGYRIKALRLIGRSAGDGPPEEIALGDGLEISADNVLSATGGGGSGAAGLIATVAPTDEGATAEDGTTAEEALPGTSWFNNATDIVHFKKLDGTWTLGTSV